MIGIIIQARLGSTRFPKKIAFPFYENKGVLELIIQSVKENFSTLPIIVATTTSSKDDKIVEICEQENVSYFRGSEENVLERFIQCAEFFNLKKIIRVCADNPFLDMQYMRDLIHQFSNLDVDYFSFRMKSGLPVIKTHYGLWTEGVTLSALKRISRLTQDKLFLEHVTNFIYSNRNFFNLEFKEVESYFNDVNLRLTMDTEEDYKLLKEIYLSYMKLENQTTKTLIDLIISNDEWLLKMDRQIKENTK